jgi:hypothetical protein
MTGKVNYFIAIFLTSMMLTLAGCGGQKERVATAKPDWVDGKSSRYPDSLYLLGRGSYKFLDAAKDRARSDLAKNFEVKIQEQSADTQSFYRKKNAEGTQQESEQAVSRSLETSTNQILSGVQIVDIWQDPKTSEYHALAILSRTQAAERLRQEIGRLDETTRINIEDATNTTDKLEKIAYASKALDAQIERIGYQRTLQVVDTTGRGIRPVWNVSQLDADFEKLLSRIRIRPLVINDTTNTLHTALSGGLAAAGVIVDEGPTADFTMEGSLVVHDLGKKEGWYWSRGTLEIKLVDSNKQVRGTKRWPVKASATDPGTATQRIGDEVSRVLQRDIQSTIIDFARSTKSKTKNI